ncbi:hypothetical protein AYI70_g8518 [Smittium culicis]|uniref:Uncharacterized protein n=1 Tax=Smittium culicis TaxID=133412 RepID=A0A1R1XFJ4_9FUNG|nr:hypothetical protein AYI70_g8518 [Smittium culicis]
MLRILKNVAFAASILFSASAQLDSCAGSVVSLSSKSYTATSSRKAYDLDNPIALPCSGSTHDFKGSFDVVTDNDFYIAFADSGSISSSNGVIEVYAGLISNKFSTSFNRYAQAKRSISTTKRSTSATISFTYSANVLSVYKDGKLAITYRNRNLVISQILIAPLVGTTTISSGSLECVVIATGCTISCPSIPVDCLDLESDIIGTVYPPNSYVSIPCPGNSYTFNTSVVSDTDLFFIALGDNGLTGSYYEGNFGIISTNSKVDDGKTNVLDPSTAYSTESVAADVSITYDATTKYFRTYINNSLVTERIIRIDLKTFAFSAYNGFSTLFGGSFTCVYPDGCPK